MSFGRLSNKKRLRKAQLAHRRDDGCPVIGRVVLFSLSDDSIRDKEKENLVFIVYNDDRDYKRRARSV